MKIASASVNRPNLATSKLLIAFRFPFDNRVNLAFVAPISPTRIFLAELDMWLFARCVYRKPKSYIMVMQAAEDRRIQEIVCLGATRIEPSLRKLQKKGALL